MTTPEHTDPRLETRYVETFDDTDETGTVTLLGVVHDHPASIYRVRKVVSEASPDIVALELPPLAVPLYKQYATESSLPPRSGGEFSAAVEAAPNASVVGIDGPSVGFVWKLANRLVRERASRETVTRSTRALLSVTATAIACRLAAVFSTVLPCQIAVGSPTVHEATWTDTPTAQSQDEHRQIRTVTAVLDAFDTSPSSNYRSKTRERHMAERLRTLRAEGDVIAVVGAGHFDPLCEHLSDDQSVTK